MDRIYEWVNNLGPSSRFYKGFSTADALIESTCRDKTNIKVTDQKAAADCLRRMGYEKSDQGYDSTSKTKTPRKWKKVIFQN